MDELYFHLGHNTPHSWSFPEIVVLQNGRGPMVVMLGAFIVYNNGDKLLAVIVKKSLHIWPVTGLSHLSAPVAKVDGEVVEEVREAEEVQDIQEVEVVERVQKKPRGRPAKDAKGWMLWRKPTFPQTQETIMEISMQTFSKNYLQDFARASRKPTRLDAISTWTEPSTILVVNT